MADPAYAERKALRLSNLAPAAARTVHREKLKGGALKSDTKKGSIFGRRFKGFTLDVLAAVNQDLGGVNVNMFVGEAAQNAAATVVEGKMRPADAVALAQACSAVHQRYDGFEEELHTQMAKAVTPEIVADVVNEMKGKLELAAPADHARLRSVLRAVGELWLVGLVDGPLWLLKQTLLPMAQALEAGATAHHTLGSLALLQAAVQRFGPEMTRGQLRGLPLRASKDDVPKPDTAAAAAAAPESPEAASESKESSGGVGDAAAAAQAEAAADADVNPAAEQALQQRREEAKALPQSMVSDKHADSAVKLFTTLTEKGLGMCAKLRKTVEEQFKKLCESTEIRGEDANAEAITKFEAVSANVSRMIGIVDALVTAVGLPEEKKVGQPDLQRAAASGNADAGVIITSRLAEFYTVSDVEQTNQYDDDEQRAFYEQVLPIEHLLPSDKAVVQRRIAEDEEEERTSLDYDAIDAIIERLPNCAATKYADSFVTDFLEESTRYFREPGTGGIDQARAYFTNCRKRLLTELRYARPSATEMLPFYARIVATLHPHFPDFGDALVKCVHGDLLATVRKKTSQVKGKKKRGGRYIAELTKFRVLPPRLVLQVLLVLTEELDAENASIWAGVVEHVGSYLMRGGVTRVRYEEAVAAFKLKRNATTNIPTVVDDEIEFALTAVKDALKPRGSYKPVEARVKSIAEEYMRHLVFKLVESQSIDTVCALVLRLPWTDPVEGPNLVRVLRKVHRCAWHRIFVLADIVASVSDVHGWVGVAVADMVIEALRTDLEHPGHRTAQRRLQDIKFLGELFNFRIVSPNAILAVLAQLLFYFPHASGPHDYSRIRAFCLMLECSLRYLLPKPASKAGKRGAKAAVPIAKCLQTLLVHFYRYVQTRAKPVPHDIDFRLSECVQAVNEAFKLRGMALEFPVNLKKADELLAKQGVTPRTRDMQGCSSAGPLAVMLSSIRAAAVASSAAVHSVRDCDWAALERGGGGKRDVAVKGSIHPVITAAGGRGEVVAEDNADGELEEDDGEFTSASDVTRSKPIDQGDEDDDVSSSGSSESDSDDSDSTDDDDDSDSDSDADSLSDSDDDEDEEEEEEEDDSALFKRGGKFVGGAGAWLALGRGGARGSAQTSALSAEELELESAFDAQMRDVLKESTAEASSKLRSGGGIHAIERNMEQRLGSAALSQAKTATLASSSRELLKASSASGAPQAPVTTAAAAAPGGGGPAKAPAQAAPSGIRLAVLRRGQNDKTEARALLVPTSDFTRNLQQVQQEHRDAAAVLRAQTLAMQRASESADAAPGRSRRR